MSHSNTMTLIFEGSHGCQMNCTGCQINKTASYFPSRQQQLELDSFLDSIIQDGLELDEVELGPTDLLSTGNRSEFFSPYLKTLIERFKLTAFQLSLIHPPEAVEDFVVDINKVANPHSKINITTPIEARHVFNDKYIKRIKDNTEIIKRGSISHVDEVVLSVIFDIDVLSNVGSKYNYEELFLRVRELCVGPDTLVDFVFHQGRRDLTDPVVGANFIKSFKEVNRFFTDDIKRSGGLSAINRIPSQLILQNDRPVEVVWRAGKLFMRPILNEGFVVEDPRFDIPKPWDAAAYRLKLVESVSRNLEYSAQLDDCQGCEHVMLCASHFMHDVLEMAGSKQCVYLLKDYKPVQLKNNTNYISSVPEAN
jgi:hypothetical protein